MLYIKRVITFLVFCSGLVVLLIVSSAIFMPKNNMTEFGMEEMTANGILGEKENSIDVLFVGDSETYSSVTPMQIWKEKGYTSYVCGSSLQTLDYTFTLVKRAFKTQKPKLVILETDAIYRDISDDTVGLTEISNLFSIFRYQNRWKTLTSNDLKMNAEYTWTEDNKGYVYSNTVWSRENSDYMTVTDSATEIPSLNMMYIKAIKSFCEANGARLVFLSTPSPVNWSYERHNGIVKLAEDLSCEYIDLNLMNDKIQIDWQQDTRDMGDHLNYYGAKKVTQYLADYLSQTGLFEDHREDSSYEKWNETLKRYEANVSD